LKAFHLQKSPDRGVTCGLLCEWLGGVVESENEGLGFPAEGVRISTSSEMSGALLGA